LVAKKQYLSGKMTDNSFVPMWQLIYAKLQHLAVIMPTDQEFQPSEIEMREVLRDLYQQPAVLRAVRRLHPNFDALSLTEKYVLLTAIVPGQDIARRKMEEAVVPIDIPYSEYPSERESP
jgi:hypothetical protein